MISSKWFSVSSLRISYSVFCSYPLPQLLPDPPSLHTQLCVLFFLVYRVKLHGPNIPGLVAFHWSVADSSGANHERKTGSSSPRTYQLPQRLMELGADFLSPWWCFLFIFFLSGTWTGLVCAVITAVSSYVRCPAVSWRYCLRAVIPRLWLLHSFHPLFRNTPWVLEEGHMTQMSHSGPTILKSLSPWPVAIYYNKMLLWGGLRNILLYGYNGVSY